MRLLAKQQEMTGGKYTRRDVLSAGAAAMTASGLTSGRVVGGAPSRPNILWLVSEDNNPLIGAYGDRLAHTPVIDALARAADLPVDFRTS
jgi:hypothetical protein